MLTEYTVHKMTSQYDILNFEICQAEQCRLKFTLHLARCRLSMLLKFETPNVLSLVTAILLTEVGENFSKNNVPPAYTPSSRRDFVEILIRRD